MGSTGLWFPALLLSVVLIALQAILGFAHGGRASFRLIAWVITPWAALWIVAFVLARQHAAGPGDTAPPFVIPGTTIPLMPAVSIVMPVHNAAATLDECLTSIVNQTFEDWELLAIDDGSDDESGAIIAEAAERDSRIRLLSPGRVGLVAALNLGLSEARAGLLARMDADDVMAVDRLEAQRARLEADVALALVSCQVRLFPDDEVLAGFREYIRWQNTCLTNEEISNGIYVESPFAHPSVMFRRDVVLRVGGYHDGTFPEDYELWLRLHETGHRMEKLDQVLLDWRESATRLSRNDPRYDRQSFDMLRAEYLARDPRVDRTRPVVFWGAGRRTRQRVRHLVARGVRPDAYIDVDQRKIGRLTDGVEVYPPDWLDRFPRPFVLALVTNHGARDLIADHLNALGYRAGSDWLAVG